MSLVMLHVLQDNSHPYDSRIERYQVNDTVKDYKHTNRAVTLPVDCVFLQ